MAHVADVVEQWYELALGPPRPALVLDASESAHALAPYLRGLAEGVLELMPESSRPSVFFLGNPRPYEPAQFPVQGENWFRENSFRGSFLSPVLEALEPDVMMAVAGAGRIFDLPDWKGHPVVESAIWIKVGPVGMTGGAYREHGYACEQLAEMLTHPLAHIEVGGPGAMPFAWDDPAFRLEGDRLIGTKATGTLRFGVLTPEPEAVTAAAVMTGGPRRPLRLQPGGPVRPSEWVRLPHAEFTLLRQCLNKNRFQCPICRHEHPAGQFRCPANTELPLFATLEALPRGGFALIDTGSWETRVRPHASPVLQLSPESVAVRDRQGGATIMRYDAATNSWRPGGQFALFHLMQDKLYALVH